MHILHGQVGAGLEQERRCMAVAEIASVVLQEACSVLTPHSLTASLRSLTPTRSTSGVKPTSSRAWMLALA